MEDALSSAVDALDSRFALKGVARQEVDIWKQILTRRGDDRHVFNWRRRRRVFAWLPRGNPIDTSIARSVIATHFEPSSLESHTVSYDVANEQRLAGPFSPRRRHAI